MTSASDFALPFSPWLSVWLKPRKAIERILATNPRRHVLLLASLGGLSVIPVGAIDGALTAEKLDWPKLAAFIVLGSAIGIASLYVSAFFLRWSGKLLGGRASQVELRAVVAWRVVPSVIGLAVCIIALVGMKLFVAAGVFAAASPVLVTTLRWLTGFLALWSLIAMMSMLARVQGFGFWRVVLNAILGLLLLPLILAVIVRTFLFQPFNIPSAAMMPTLLIGDYFFVWPIQQRSATARSAVLRKDIRIFFI
jgi:hypothetical protein